MATFDGAKGDDTYVGTAEADIIHGNGGDDTLSGGDGNDTIYGDAGDDVLDGGAGRHSLYAGFGRNVLRGGEGFDTFYSVGGTDAIYAGSLGGLWDADYTLQTRGIALGDATGAFTGGAMLTGYEHLRISPHGAYFINSSTVDLGTMPAGSATATSAR